MSQFWVSVSFEFGSVMSVGNFWVWVSFGSVLVLGQFWVGFGSGSVLSRFWSESILVWVSFGFGSALGWGQF